ncbi:MAG TPA: hypothetical protein VLN41_02635, partial [Candidatus Bathyarchaeia archaeon]|nr:hypothetical protein [Candidatus Bathyarchaeia archaeon]
MTTQISLSDEQLERVREELSSKGLASAVALIRQLSSADLAGAVAYARQLQKTLSESEEPATGPEQAGVLAAISEPGHNVVCSTELFVLSGDAQTELGRAPDFEDSHVVSWG